MRVIIFACLGAMIVFFPLAVNASSIPGAVHTTTTLESIIKRTTAYYGEMESYPPNTHPFQIEFSHYDEHAKTFTGNIQYLEGQQTKGQIKGSVLGKELIFTETGKHGVFTLSVQGDHLVKGVWRGNSTFGGEVTKEVWFQTH